MLISVSLSKPSKCVGVLGREYVRAKIALADGRYFAEFFTKTQSFHKWFSREGLDAFLNENVGKTFLNCVQRTEDEEIVFTTSRRGKVQRVVKPLKNKGGVAKNADGAGGNCAKGTVEAFVEREVRAAHRGASQNRQKNYIIQEGMYVPFLQALGVMNSNGKVLNAKQAKFRQINRFLEFVDDVLPKARGDGALTVLDFGSGKSYLTFALHYYLSQIKKIGFRIVGIDLKKDVVEHCAALAEKLKLTGIEFVHGDIADFDEDIAPDIVISLHACDTATDYALRFAIERKARVVLSVPCCQYEINSQLAEKNAADVDERLRLFLKHGIVRERFSALATDCVRAEVLESAGYKVQLMEFVDIENTPKNLLIRAVRRGEGATGRENAQVSENARRLLDALGVRQCLADMK